MRHGYSPLHLRVICGKLWRRTIGAMSEARVSLAISHQPRNCLRNTSQLTSSILPPLVREHQALCLGHRPTSVHHSGRLVQEHEIQGIFSWLNLRHVLKLGSAYLFARQHADQRKRSPRLPHHQGPKGHIMPVNLCVPRQGRISTR